MKKIIIILIIIILLILTVLLILNIKPKIEITLVEDLTIEFLGKKKVSDFIISINGVISDDFTIDTTSAGIKTVYFDFINDDNRKASYSYDITVTDDIPPIIWLSDSYSITVESEDNLIDKILCGDNADDSPSRYIDGFYDLNTVGTYPLTYIATDSSGNKTIKDFNLKVIEKSDQSPVTNVKVTLFSDIIEKHKTDTTLIGLDISKWQEDVDFEKIKEAGVEFIYIRVGTAVRKKWRICSRS